MNQRGCIALLLVRFWWTAAVAEGQEVLRSVAEQRRFLASFGSEQELLIKDRAGNEKRGRVSNVSEESVTLSHRGEIGDVELRNIEEVHRLDPKSKTRNLWMGGLIGVGAYAIGHAAIYTEDPAPVHFPADAFGLLGSAGLGVLLGALLPSGTNAVLLYRFEAAGSDAQLSEPELERSRKVVSMARHVLEGA